MMEKVNEESADNFDEIYRRLDGVYRNAYWAIEAGATKENLVSQIDQALECLGKGETECDAGSL